MGSLVERVSDAAERLGPALRVRCERNASRLVGHDENIESSRRRVGIDIRSQFAAGSELNRGERRFELSVRRQTPSRSSGDGASSIATGWRLETSAGEVDADVVVNAAGPCAAAQHPAERRLAGPRPRFSRDQPESRP